MACQLKAGRSLTRGLFITLEGGEGAGKSTQAKLLVEKLSQMGINCVVTREPGGSPGAEKIRELFVKGEPDRWSSTTEALLVTAGRADHVERTILPALERGEWVICDRFYDSTVAYQGGGGGLGADWDDERRSARNLSLRPSRWSARSRFS